MTKITNLSRETRNFPVGGFDENGEPNMGHVHPGETANLSVDVESVEVKAAVHAGLIRIEKSASKPAAPKPKGKAKASAKAPAKPAGEPATDPAA